MRYDSISLFQCPVCNFLDLEHFTFSEFSPQEIDEGVVWCGNCNSWFPVEGGLLDLLTGNLSYTQDRQNFWQKYSVQLEKIGLSPIKMVGESRKDLQTVQQSHFDWYANNELQTYSAYEKQPFWKATDRLAFDLWRKDVVPGGWLLDVGCAEGRSTFNFMDLDINIVGFDVSKLLVRQAISRYRAGNYKAKAVFCAADASRFPFKSSSFNYVLIYGVLHHLPEPIFTCKEVVRVLKIDGKYFGSENNQSAFRVVFDLMQRLTPLWHEEAGPEALISSKMLSEAFKDTNMEWTTYTSVFAPPHLVNLFSQKMADWFLTITDRFGRAVPVLRNNGGLIVINGIKSERK